MRGQPAQTPSFTHLGPEQGDLLFALADLRNWQEDHEDEVVIADDHLRLSHDAIASLTAKAAAALSLPPDVHLTLKTDVTGVLGRSDFRLDYEWLLHGQRQMPKRIGAFLQTAEGPRRIPLWMKRALDLADGFDSSRPIEDHWSALAEFRQALEPDDAIPSSVPANREMAGLSMTAFLRGLEVRIANRFSISPDRSLGQFEVVPYSSRRLEADGIAEHDISEANAELTGEALAVFQNRLHTRGARPAYQLGNNSYLVIDKSSAPILEELARVQKADRAERKAFIENPRAFITEAVNRHLSNQGAFDGLDEASQEELVESIAGPGLVESREYSERVVGVVVYRKSGADFEGSGTAWLPEAFPEPVAEAIKEMSLERLKDLRDEMTRHLDGGGEKAVTIDGQDVRVTPERLAAVEAQIKGLENETEGRSSKSDEQADDRPSEGPIILDTLDNFASLSWHAALRPRKTSVPFGDTRDHHDAAARTSGRELSLGHERVGKWPAGYPECRRTGTRQNAANDRVPELAAGPYALA
ncbi:MAG: hypothetical protein R3D65_09535 [Zhengella sp.]|uniref:hypothetical protein n=1 Tax=Zhengella sp. TaxID=2282762 RepID=UPI003528BB3E